jgi:Na+/H+ antiporter NhaC
MATRIRAKLSVYFNTMRLSIYKTFVDSFLKALAFFWLQDNQMVRAEVKALNKTLAVENDPFRKHRLED